MAAVRRIEFLQLQLQSIPTHSDCSNVKNSNKSSPEQYKLYEDLRKIKVTDVEVEVPPSECEECYNGILTAAAIAFVAELAKKFEEDVQKMLNQRIKRKVALQETGLLPDFPRTPKYIREGNWKISPVPRRLLCRHVDCGDVSPSNKKHFIRALKSSAQGIQVDFDDGHCPTWSNQLQGLYNVYQTVHNKMSGVPEIHKVPVLMFRPRAWNMVEHNMRVMGKEVPGPLFDFGIHLFHNAHVLYENESGPYLYLSKVEGHNEARLWNDIFVWTEKKLRMPHGAIKACVLIENVHASFETHEILYELREHSAGLNCGIWDYSASFVNKFGHRKDFVLPDRNVYVNMDQHFLKSYMDLVVQTCHQHGAHATGGMTALLLPLQNDEKRQKVMTAACKAKLKEIHAGADGFMVYDLDFIHPMQQLFERFAPTANQIHVKRCEVKIMKENLLLMPPGGVTLNGLKHNISVGILFIYSWLCGKGHFFYKDVVEDSATAEISRSQVWQWLHHGCKLEESNEVISRKMVQSLITDFILKLFHDKSTKWSTPDDRKLLINAAQVFEVLVTKKEFPEFITTYLNEQALFWIPLA